MIIGFSGRKQSGKNTSCNFCMGTFLWQNGVIENTYKINEKGSLVVTDILGDTNLKGILDTSILDSRWQDFLEKNVYPICKIYSFADILKQTVCIDVLGLSREACYGTDEQKDAQTHLKWEDMPGVVSEEEIKRDLHDSLMGMTLHDPGPMTGREVMQYVGTNIFRKMYGNVWVEATIRKIKADKAEFALVTDVRFPNEVESIQQEGGIVIRLTKQKFEDTHQSETALDSFGAFDFTIKNDDLTIETQNSCVMQILLESGVPLCI